MATWVAIASTPSVVFRGGALAFDSANGKLYALRGDANTTAWVYTPTANTWTAIASTPSVVFRGGALAFDSANGKLYALSGDTNTTAWVYTPTANTWTAIASTPSVVSGGGALAFDSANGKLYALRGDATTTAWVYTPTANTWTAIASTPSVVSYGGALAFDSANGKLYALSGDTNKTAWVYTPTANTWTAIASTPSAVGGGGALAFDSANGKLYALRGDATKTAWVYTPTANTWTALASTPSAVSYGGALAFDSANGKLYALLGDTTTTAWVYYTPNQAETADGTLSATYTGTAAPTVEQPALGSLAATFAAADIEQPAAGSLAATFVASAGPITIIGAAGSLTAGFTASAALSQEVTAAGSLTADYSASASPVAEQAAGSGMPPVKIQIALTGTAWAGTNWVTISPFVRSFTSTQGREHELQQTEAGKCVLTLTNQDGRFSPWSTNSPYYNQLPPTDSNPTGGTGTWTTSAATLSRTTTTPRFGQYAWSLTAVTDASMSMVSDAKTVATPKRTYTAYAWVRSGPGAPDRSVTVSILWKTSAGTVIQTTTGSARSETSAWQTAPFAVRGVCPAGAVSKDIEVTVLTADSGEVHDVACVGISDVTWARPAAVTQGWCVGQQIPLTPATPIRITTTVGGTDYPVFAGVVATWVPKYGLVKATQVVTCYDYMHLLALAMATGSTFFAEQVIDGAELQWRLNTPSGTTVAATGAGNGHTGVVSGSVDFGATAPDTPAPAPLKGGVTTLVHLAGGTITGTVARDDGAVTIEAVLLTSSSTDPIITVGDGDDKLAISYEDGYYYVTVNGTAHQAGEVATNAWHYITLTQSAAGTVAFNVWNTTGSSVGFDHAGTVTTTGKVKLGNSSGAWICGFAVYTSVLSATLIAAHRQAWATGSGSMLSGRQIKAELMSANIPPGVIGTIGDGSVVCITPLVTSGQTQLLEVIQTTQNTEQGMVFCKPTGLFTFVDSAQIAALVDGPSQCTFADDGTPAHIPPLAGSCVPAYDDITVWNFIPVGVQGDTTTETSAVYYAQTPDSIARYGQRALTGYTGMYFATPTAAQALADTLCARYAQPKTRVRSVACSSTATDGKWFPYMLGLKLLTMVEVKWQPTDGSDSPFVQTSQIERITHTVTKTTWTTSFMLCPTVVS